MKKDEAEKCKDVSKKARGAVHPDNPLSDAETTTPSSASDECECWTNLGILKCSPKIQISVLIF